MASNGEQLIPLGWVADSGVPPVKVVNTARATALVFDGSLAVTLSEATRIYDTVRAEQAEQTASTSTCLTVRKRKSRR